MTQKLNLVPDDGLDFRREAFSRNLGWVTPDEADRLADCRVAVAGLGGVGGSHTATLARLGIGAFHLADLDRFELANFNRQRGALTSTIGKPKVDVLADRTLDINPHIDVRRFPNGVQPDNVDEFLDGVDLYVDGLDFFAVEARRLVFAKCHEKGIPQITAAPLGMGTSVINFVPGRGLSFEEYFRLEGQSQQEQLIRFLIGLAPAGLHAKYLVDPSKIDLANHRGPSTPMGCELCAGVLATNALKILLGRGKVLTAPWVLQYDAYRNRYKKTWRPGGNNNPLQRLILSVARRKFSAKTHRATSTESSSQPSSEPAPAVSNPMSTNPAPRPIDEILDVARWAPSGDNVQNWRFEIAGERSLVVHGYDTRDHCVYDLNGKASQLALGALVESVRIAATKFGWRTNVKRRATMPDHKPTFDITFEPDANIVTHTLFDHVHDRCTNRRPYKTKPLSVEERHALESAVGEDYRIIWKSSFKDRLAMARLLFKSAHIRLTTREAFDTHSSVIEWRCTHSDDRIPDKAIGLDPMTTRLMQWALGSWGRVKFMNTFLAGTVAPRIQLDFMTGLRCGAHFVMVANRTPETIDDYVDAGRAVQRFWLTAAKLGMQLQPEMTPLIFSGYVREDVAFTHDLKAVRTAGTVSQQLEGMLGHKSLVNAVFLARVGHGSAPKSRSLRKPVASLMHVEQAPPAAERVA